MNFILNAGPSLSVAFVLIWLPWKFWKNFHSSSKFWNASCFNWDPHRESLASQETEPFWTTSNNLMIFFLLQPSFWLPLYFGMKDTFMFPGHIAYSSSQLCIYQPDCMAHDIVLQYCSVGFLGFNGRKKWAWGWHSQQDQLKQFGKLAFLCSNSTG